LILTILCFDILGVIISMKQKNSLFYFSINDQFIPKNVPLPFDLFINSSVLDDHPHYIRIKRIFDIITQEDINIIKTNYSTLYVAESQRASLFQALSSDRELSDPTKVTLFKNFTINYLEKAFHLGSDYSNLNQIIINASEALEHLLTIFAKKNISDASKIITELAVHDFYTFDHSINVAIYTSIFYRHLFPNSSYEEILSISLAALFHDIGKVKIPNEILNKPGKFNHFEYEKIKAHPKYGLDIIANLDIEDEEIDLKILKSVIYQHHENCNGTGYPMKLTADKISPFAKIVAIVDFYDAITTKRPYCEVFSTENAILLMEKSVNKKIDGDFFNEFKKLIKDMVFVGNERKSLIDEFDPCLPNITLPLVYEQVIIDEKTIIDEKKIGVKDSLKHFLIIDDDESFVTILSMFLKKIHISCQITSATSGLTGLNLLRSRLGKFDYVFIDVQLPELNGINILRELSRHHEENINSFIYIISANDIPSDINQLEDLSYVSGFIKKPITFSQFESIFYQYKKINY